MTTEADKPTEPRRPWWFTSRGLVVIAIVFVLGVLVAAPLLSLVTHVGWLIVLLALTGWLVVPDLHWVWREHPEVFRRVLRLLTNARTVRVLLYLAVAYAWALVLFN
ncbi:hypothetical protein Pla123a_15560 [Posidoniimonas polymericola]|uniref:Uncharacterized protein n=1 Tax=Posidoniimonas polymericola TaxID=2528002 RepID=A0A5C5YSM3_9BACT|nr:hypothetical protein [Posidoniimonas polymericola]TWT77760.1 hypothetical protein Pla123a_15560 [Posidoniimonas polymericola]